MFFVDRFNYYSMSLFGRVLYPIGSTVDLILLTQSKVITLHKALTSAGRHRCLSHWFVVVLVTTSCHM